MFQKLLGLSLVAAVSAHQNFHQFWVNDVTPGYEIGVRMPPSNSPVTDVTSDDIACNVDGSTVPSGVTTAAANEGDTITVNWDTSSHPGPITHFLFGPVDDAAQATGIGAGWFKIDERDYVDDQWASDYMSGNGGNYTFTLPTGLESGDYLTIDGAQFYIGCAQLTVTGTGSGSCTPEISLPGAYTDEDDDIYIPDFYNGFDATTYTAPGGSVATCGGSGAAATTAASSAATTSAASSAVTTSAAVSTATSAATTSSAAVAVASSAASSDDEDEDDDSCDADETEAASSAAPTSTFVTRTASSAAAASKTASSSHAATSSQAASSGSVALYGQCGGVNYSGSTTCASGTCQASNDYYSQCV